VDTYRSLDRTNSTHTASPDPRLAPGPLVLHERRGARRCPYQEVRPEAPLVDGNAGYRRTHPVEGGRGRHTDRQPVEVGDLPLADHLDVLAAEVATKAGIRVRRHRTSRVQQCGLTGIAQVAGTQLQQARHPAEATGVLPRAELALSVAHREETVTDEPPRLDLRPVEQLAPCRLDRIPPDPFDHARPGHHFDEATRAGTAHRQSRRSKTKYKPVHTTAVRTMTKG